MAGLEDYKGLDEGQLSFRKEMAIQSMIQAAVGEHDPAAQPTDARVDPLDETGLTLPIMEELDGHRRHDLYS